MTSPGGDSINLAALWIPVMPETSQIGTEMEKAGKQAKQSFEQGFNSAGSSPEALGSSFGAKLQESIGKGLKGIELPLGLGTAIDKLGGDIDKNLVNKLKNEAGKALTDYRKQWDELSQATQKYTQQYEALDVAQARSGAADYRILLERAAGWDQLTKSQKDSLVTQYGEADAIDHVAVKASVMLPLLTEQTAAHKELTEAQGNAGAAYEEMNKHQASAGESLGNYTSKAKELKAAVDDGAGSNAIMAGIMGGAVVAGAGLAAKGVEALIDAVKDGFEEGVDAAKEFADKMVELGETYEGLEHQVTEFAGGSDEALEKLTGRAQAVFGSLDVAGADTGKTMAQFASILNAEPGPALDLLTKHVEELQGRFTDLKAQNLATIFADFKVPLEDTDSALASLLQNSRNSGQDLGVFVQSLSGAAADTLREAGLNIQQAGAFLGDISKTGVPANTVITSMASIMKEAKKEGLDFKDGMKAAGDQLKALGDTAAGQDLAETLFGTRRWAVAIQAVQSYTDVVRQGPDAFNASSSSIDDFLQRTEDLGNKWEEVKHKAEEAFLPVGEKALGLVSHAMDSIIGYVKTHMDTIKHDIQQGGVYFIQFAAQVQQMAIGVLEFFAPIVNAVDSIMGAAITSLGAFAQVSGDVLSHIPGFHDIGDGLINAGKAAEGFGQGLDKINVGQKMKDVASWLKQHQIDVGDATQKWIDFGDHVGDALDTASDRAQAFAQNNPALAAVPGASLAFGAGAPAGLPTGVPGLPKGAASASGPGVGSAADASADPATVTGHHVADWDAIAAKEGGGQWNITYTTGVPEGGGLQIKQGTWDQYGGPALTGTEKPYQATKEQQEEIAERILNGWNGIPGQGPAAWDNGRTYVEKHATGGAPGRYIGNGSGSKDDVAALLKRGEYVWDTDTMDKYGWLITAMHQGTSGYDQGGGTSPNGGILGAPEQDFSVNGVTAQGASNGAAQILQAFAQWFNDNIEPVKELAGYDRGGHGLGDKSNHASGTALDINWSDFTALQGHGADAGSHFSPAQMQEISQELTALGMTWGQYWTPDSRDPGHFELGGADYAQKGPQNIGGLPSAANGALPGGKNGGLYPGLPGQYGGNGVYGGETDDTVYESQQAVQSARDEQTRVNHEADVAQRKVDDLKAELAKGDPKAGQVGPLGGVIAETPEETAAWATKQKELNDQLSDATFTLSQARQAASEQTGKVTHAETKAQEDMYKKPKGSGTGESGEAKAGETLGGGLLAGIGQELGIGDILGKSPMDWGIVKLFTGLFKYADGLGDAIFGKTAAGNSFLGMGGPEGAGAGMAQGALGSIGLKLPSLSGGPNVQPGPGPTPFGTGGPLPGPASAPGATTIIHGDVNPINVSPNVDPAAILGPVQEQQNSTNSSAFQFSGGLPAP